MPIPVAKSIRSILSGLGATTKPSQVSYLNKLLKGLKGIGMKGSEQRSFLADPSSIKNFFRVSRARKGALAGAAGGLAQGVYNDENFGDTAGRILGYAGGGAALGGSAPRKLMTTISPALKYGVPAAGIGAAAYGAKQLNNPQAEFTNVDTYRRQY